ncbi:YrzE family protein [Bartonella sp. B35(2025)]
METRIPGDTSFDTHFLKETSLEEQYPLFHIPISWSAIFAGLVTTLASLICLSFLIAALGLTQIDFYSSSPFEGTFLSVGIGSLIAMLISLAGGSFVAGHFAETAGAFHGFLTWALLTLLMTIQTILFVSGSVNLGTKAISANITATQQDITNLETDTIPLLSKLNSESFEKLLHTKNEEIDFEKLRNDLHTALNRSEVPSLNPDRLKQSYKEALKEIDSTITAFKNDPSHYRTYLKNLSNRLSNHAQTITANINQNDIINDLMNNGITHADAQAMANNALHIYQTAEAKTEKAIKALKQQANILSKKLDMPIKDTRYIADKAVKTASSIGWWGFLGGLIGAIISSIFGYYGYKSRKDSFML